MKYTIRRATIADLPRLQRLFYNTVTTIGAKSYSKAELKAWTRNASDKAYWELKFIQNNFYVAMLNGEVVGFISLSGTGYIDYIYVSHKYQGRGIASLLYEEVEEIAKAQNFEVLTSDVSSIARPFFEKKGFEVLKKNEHHVDGEVLINYSVKKVIVV